MIGFDTRWSDLIPDDRTWSRMIDIDPEWSEWIPNDRNRSPMIEFDPQWSGLAIYLFLSTKKKKGKHFPGINTIITEQDPWSPFMIDDLWNNNPSEGLKIKPYFGNLVMLQFKLVSSAWSQMTGLDLGWLDRKPGDRIGNCWSYQIPDVWMGYWMIISNHNWTDWIPVDQIGSWIMR